MQTVLFSALHVSLVFRQTQFTIGSYNLSRDEGPPLINVAIPPGLV